MRESTEQRSHFFSRVGVLNKVVNRVQQVVKATPVQVVNVVAIRHHRNQLTSLLLKVGVRACFLVAQNVHVALLA